MPFRAILLMLTAYISVYLHFSEFLIIFTYLTLTCDPQFSHSSCYNDPCLLNQSLWTNLVSLLHVVAISQLFLLALSFVNPHLIPDRQDLPPDCLFQGNISRGMSPFLQPLSPAPIGLPRSSLQVVPLMFCLCLLGLCPNGVRKLCCRCRSRRKAR